MDKHAEMATFVHVIDDGGFSQAARALKRTPSAVSKQITRLEDRLGISLLHRTTRRLHLTEAGEIYYHHARRILAEVEDAEYAASRLQEAVRGTLRVTTSAAFGESQMVPLLIDFHDLYPDLHVELLITDRMVDLVAEGFDIAIRVASRLADSSVIARRIASNRRVVCAAPAYVDRFGKPEKPEDLRDHNCLTFSQQTQLNTWHFAGPDNAVTVHVTGSFESNNSQAVYQAAKRGLGLVRISTFSAGDDIRAGNLMPVLTEYGETSDSSLYAIYPAGRYPSPNVRAFIDFLVDRLTPTPPWDEGIL